MRSMVEGAGRGSGYATATRHRPAIQPTHTGPARLQPPPSRRDAAIHLPRRGRICRLRPAFFRANALPHKASREIFVQFSDSVPTARILLPSRRTGRALGQRPCSGGL